MPWLHLYAVWVASLGLLSGNANTHVCIINDKFFGHLSADSWWKCLYTCAIAQVNLPLLLTAIHLSWQCSLTVSMILTASMHVYMSSRPCNTKSPHVCSDTTVAPIPSLLSVLVLLCVKAWAHVPSQLPFLQLLYISAPQHFLLLHC